MNPSEALLPFAPDFYLHLGRKWWGPCHTCNSENHTGEGVPLPQVLACPGRRLHQQGPSEVDKPLWPGLWIQFTITDSRLSGTSLFKTMTLFFLCFITKLLLKNAQHVNSNWNDKHQMIVWGKGCALLFKKNGYINAHFNNWHKIPLIG